MDIADSAHRHGVSVEDMLSALDSRIVEVAHRPQPANVRVWIGLARDGRHLEIGVLDLPGTDPVIFHAMPLRRNWRRFLP